MRDAGWISQEIAKVEVTKFQPITGMTIHENDEAFKADLELLSSRTVPVSEDTESEIQRILDELPQKEEWEDVKLQPHEFEKDDDTNFHIDYIVACANLRAQNYDIEPADRSKIKRIAGRIIPAIATTTAVVTGLVCLEVYKLLQKHQNIRSYRNTFLNLASSFITCLSPTAPNKQQVKIRTLDSSIANEYSIFSILIVNSLLGINSLFKEI